MQIKQNGSQASSIGPAEQFHRPRPARPHLRGGRSITAGRRGVTFDPRARTVWHTHPVGQLLIITAGSGRVGTWGGPVQEVKAGDIVWFEPGEKHWHGAGRPRG